LFKQLEKEVQEESKPIEVSGPIVIPTAMEIEAVPSQSGTITFRSVQ